MKRYKRAIIEPSLETDELPANESNGDVRSEPAPEEIAALAHLIWKQQGRPEGRALEHWAEAEKQVRRKRVETTNAGDR